MPATPPKTGDLLGERYQLEFRLPDAGLGEPWTARDRQEEGAPVLVKLLGAGGAGEIDDPRSLPALVARMKRIDHPDVLPVRAWGDHEDRLYLVHPRFEGRSLASWIAGHRKARTRPGLATAQRILDRVAGALQAVREGRGADNNAPHGAVSPRSVVTRREGPGRYDLTVMDFGLAALLVPVTGEHPLDAAWRAPEQSSGSSEETPRTDVFALALMLAEVLGVAQSTGPDAALSWARLALEDPAKVRVRLGSIRSDVPHAIWDVVARALSADPAQRPADPGEFRAILQQSWKKVGLWEKPALTPEPEPPDVPPPADAPSEVPRTRFAPAQRARSTPVPAPAPATLPIAAPALTPPVPAVSQPPSRGLLGLGGAPLGASGYRPGALGSLPAQLPPLPPYVDDAPTMMPGNVRSMAPSHWSSAAPALVTARDEDPATLLPPPRDRPYAFSDSTSIDVRLPIGEGPEETTGEDPPPIDEDPSPTPPDGIPAVLTSSGAEPRGFRMGSRLSAPPEEARTEALRANESEVRPSAKPVMNRLRARTIGAEESATFSASTHGASGSPDPEGTRMIRADWESVETPALAAPPRNLSQTLPESGDPFATSAHDPLPGGARPQDVDRTITVDLSASGVDPAPPPPGMYPPPQPSPDGSLNHVWGAAPPARLTAPPQAPTAPTSTTWWIVGGVALAVLLMMLVVLVRT